MASQAWLRRWQWPLIALVVTGCLLTLMLVSPRPAGIPSSTASPPLVSPTRVQYVVYTGTLSDRGYPPDARTLGGEYWTTVLFSMTLASPNAQMTWPAQCSYHNLEDLPRCKAILANGQRTEEFVVGGLTWSPDGRSAVLCRAGNKMCLDYPVWNLATGVRLDVLSYRTWSGWTPGEPHTLAFVTQAHYVVLLDTETGARTMPVPCPEWILHKLHAPPDSALAIHCRGAQATPLPSHLQSPPR